MAIYYCNKCGYGNQYDFLLPDQCKKCNGTFAILKSSKVKKDKDENEDEDEEKEDFKEKDAQKRNKRKSFRPSDKEEDENEEEDDEETAGIPRHLNKEDVFIENLLPKQEEKKITVGDVFSQDFSSMLPRAPLNVEKTKEDFLKEWQEQNGSRILKTKKHSLKK